MGLHGGLDDGSIAPELHTTTTHKHKDPTRRGSAESPRIMVGHHASTNIKKEGGGGSRTQPSSKDKRRRLSPQPV